jgi:hypothetical protein
MQRIVRRQIACIAGTLALVSLQVWGAPRQKEAGTGPVPAPLITAKKAFISNAGGGCSPFGQSGFSGGPDRPYNEFYTAMKSWGRYELVTAPADADLDLEINFACPAARASSPFGNSYGTADDPQLRLVILDVKTRIVLWGLTEHVEPAILQGNRDKNFERGMSSLVSNLKLLVAGPVPQPGGGPTSE